MEFNDFEIYFEQLVASPLKSIGFSSKGKGLFYENGEIQIALIRGSGRFALSGSIAHILAFRHKFLRCKNEKVSPKQPTEPGEYPWVIDPELLAMNDTSWKFNPALLMSLPYGQLEYKNSNREDVISKLTQLRSIIERSYLPWALSLKLEDALEEMKQNYEKWWVARLWYEDYKNRIEGIS